MKFLRQQIMGCCFLLCLCGTSLANEIKTDNTSDETVVSSHNNNLSSEQLHYVQLECEGFAKIDNISSEERLAYIKTCIEELSTAVVKAIEQIKTKSKLPVVNENNDESLEG